MTASWRKYHLPAFIPSRKTSSCRDGEERYRDRILGASHERKRDKAPYFVALLRDCTKSKDLYKGHSLHDDILRKGLLAECLDALVTMYAKCGALAKAKELFDVHKSQDLLTWTALIGGFAQKGQGEEAVHYYDLMRHEDIFPDAVTYSSVLKACASLGQVDRGERIHVELVKQGLLGRNIVLGTALVDMYAKCGDLPRSGRVLAELLCRNVISWNALITGYAQQGKVAESFDCLEHMKQETILPNAVTLICLLKACGSMRALDKGSRIHDEITKQGLLGDDVVLGTALVDMYAKCGALAKAQGVLEGLPVRSVISWNALIAGYVEHFKGEQALACFEQMEHEGLSADEVTFACILKACGIVGAVDRGEKIHDKIAKQGLLGSNTVLGTSLVDMYAKCGAFAKARKVLEQLPLQDVMSWTALISGYAQYGKGELALTCFDEMQGKHLSGTAMTCTCVLNACGNVGALDRGEQVHNGIAKEGLLRHNIVLGTALVDMYVKCGALAKARQVFEELSVRDIVSWCSIIVGYAREGEGKQALNSFAKMQDEGISPDATTLVCILKACGCIGAAYEGESICDEINRRGLLENNHVLATAVVDMYAKCGALAKARQVLEKLPVQNVTCWNALIAGYAQHCESIQALNCLERMQQEGLSPDAATFSSILSACSRLGLQEDAWALLANMSKTYGINPDVEHYSCMVDLLGRAGHLNGAQQVIEKMASSNNGVWSALLSACQKWGNVKLGKWVYQHAV